MRALIAVAALAVAVSGCTFVKMAPDANKVQVVSESRSMSACQKRGEVVVSVKDSLGPYQREPMRVLDELETLARNEAPGLGADTVQPKGAPVDGEQRFLAWRCAGSGPAASSPVNSGTTDGNDRAPAETTPLKD